MRSVDLYRKNKTNLCPRAVFYDNTRGSRAVVNTSHFYVRNTMTGLKKSPEERTHNETEVLHNVFTGIQAENARRVAAFPKKMEKAKQAGGLKSCMMIKKALKSLEPLPYPDTVNWMLSYAQLDAIFKHTKNPAYYSTVSQVNQQAIKKALGSWKSYFSSLKDWKKYPGKYKAKPNIPGYIRADETTAHFTNQVAKPLKKNGMLYLLFTNYGEYCIGKVPFKPEDLVKTEIKPCYGGYRIILTYKDRWEKPAVPKDPGRVLAIDTGVSNFFACAPNFCAVPFLIDGHWLKSMNQWFNKERARLLSRLTKGEDSQHSEKHSRRLDALSRRRYYVFRDFFYKTAHYIFRWCVEHKVDVIVIGHNKGQKQDINIGKANNQNFVSIPMLRAIEAMEMVSPKYGIPLVVREESYTSKASLLDFDPLPTYGKNDADGNTFSGKRTRRGLYRSADGTELNADLNAAGNIGRKEYPDAYAGKDFHFLAESVDVVRRESLSCAMKKHDNLQGYRQVKSPGALLRHEERKQAREKYGVVFSYGNSEKQSKADYIKDALKKEKEAA